MKRILLALCLAPPASPATADIMVMGLGTESCGAWVEKRKTNDWTEDGQWVLGYVTGMNGAMIAVLHDRRPEGQGRLSRWFQD